MELFAEELKQALIEEIKKAEDPATEAAEVIEYAIEQISTKVQEEVEAAQTPPEGEEIPDPAEAGEVNTEEEMQEALAAAKAEGIEEGRRAALESVIEDTAVGKALIALEAIKQTVLPLVREDLEEVAQEDGNVYEELQSLRAQVAELTEAKDKATTDMEEERKKRNELSKSLEAADEVQTKLGEMVEAIDSPEVKTKVETLVESMEISEEKDLDFVEKFIALETSAAEETVLEAEEEHLLGEEIEKLAEKGAEDEGEKDTYMENLKHIAGLV